MTESGFHATGPNRIPGHGIPPAGVVFRTHPCSFLFFFSFLLILYRRSKNNFTAGVCFSLFFLFSLFSLLFSLSFGSFLSVFSFLFSLLSVFSLLRRNRRNLLTGFPSSAIFASGATDNEKKVHTQPSSAEVKRMSNKVLRYINEAEQMRCTAPNKQRLDFTAGALLPFLGRKK